VTDVSPAPKRIAPLQSITMKRILTASLVLTSLATFAAEASAQSPLRYPVGVRVPYPIANDSDLAFEVTPCPPWVTDEFFVPIQSFQLCSLWLLFLGPGGVYTEYWDQRNGANEQVAPGLYYMSGVPVVIDASLLTAITPLGRPFVGYTRSIELASPTTPNGLYVLAAAGSSSVGIDLGCGVTFPLDFDALLLQSVTTPSVFANFIGQFDAQGYSTAPSIAVPGVASLAGIQFDLAFAVLDPFAPCGVALVSQSVSTAIIP
jgi:hypothetical protein